MGESVLDIDWTTLSDEQAIVEALHGLMSELGMTGFVFAYTPVSMLPNGQPGTIRRILSGGFDREALDEWTRTTNPNSVGYRPLSHNFDPIRNYMAHQLLPQRIILKQFLSDQATARNVMATNWIQNLIHRGLRETFYTPVFTSAGELWSLGALRLETNPNTDDLTEDQYAHLHWVTSCLAWTCIERLNWRESGQPLKGNLLTQRELDCLLWSAQGHSAGETAEVLAISTETVRTHLKNAIRKLNARNKTQAVVIAHKSGFLPIS